MNLSSVTGSFLAGTFIAIAPLSGLAADLCQAHETELFQCVTSNQKTISICEVKGSSEPRIYYRFGTLRQVELQFPSAAQPAASSFTKNFYSWPKGSSSQLGFEIGQTRYTVYSFNSALEDDEQHGVFVERANQKPRSISCEPTNPSGLASALERLPLPEHELRDVP